MMRDSSLIEMPLQGKLHTLSFVASPPNTLFFGGLNQFFPNFRMGDVNQGFGPLPRGQARQISHAVLRYDVRGLGPGRRDDVAARKFRQDVGMAFALAVDAAGLHGQEGLAVFGSISTGDEVELSARTADVPCTGRFGTDLSVEVDGNAAVDRDEIVELANRFRVVDVVHRC